MKTLLSLTLISALFTTLLTLGTSKSSAETESNPWSAGTSCHGADDGFVHDAANIRLFLLYHNPSTGAVPARPRTQDPPITLSI